MLPVVTLRRYHQARSRNDQSPTRMEGRARRTALGVCKRRQIDTFRVSKRHGNADSFEQYDLVPLDNSVNTCYSSLCSPSTLLSSKLTQF